MDRRKRSSYEIRWRTGFLPFCVALSNRSISRAHQLSIGHSAPLQGAQYHSTPYTNPLAHLGGEPSLSIMVRGRKANLDLPLTPALQQQREFREKRANLIVGAMCMSLTILHEGMRCSRGQHRMHLAYQPQWDSLTKAEEPAR